MLYVRGSAPALHSELSVAIVGTRNPTDFGLEVARRTGRVFQKREHVWLVVLHRDAIPRPTKDVWRLKAWEWRSWLTDWKWYILRLTGI